MNGKIPSIVTEIAIDGATFHGCSFKPTFINFLFGKNGVGKSTIARSIGNGHGLTWSSQFNPDDFDVLVYDTDFIKANLSNYEGLPGVFTISEQNIEIQDKINAKRNDRRTCQEEYQSAQQDLQGKQQSLVELTETFQNDIWNSTTDVRARFEKALNGLKRKQGLADVMLKTAAEKADVHELENLYDTVFDTEIKTYPLLTFPDSGLPDSDLLGKAIISSAQTPFAQFIKQLGASDWVKHGHETYSGISDGKCPYCQQALPANFEKELQACFDQVYTDSLNELARFKKVYEQTVEKLLYPLEGNETNDFPEFERDTYKDRLQLLKNKLQENIRFLQDKLREPALAVDLNDVGELLKGISNIITRTNALISKHNDIVNSSQKKKNECVDAVRKHLAFILKTDIERYRKSQLDLENEIKTLNAKISLASKKIHDLSIEIAKLNRQVVNTSSAVECINALLHDSGFEGFHLCEKPDVPGVYEVRRDTGEIADRLSEGERNFIAFLYFYQLVKGTLSSDGTSKAKIVVIDDPVSSMDSSSLFIVSALVREMIEICHNSVDYLHKTNLGDYIRQIFILTHNAYFHREITYNQVQRFKDVSFFLVEKHDNRSTVIPCLHEKDDASRQLENYNPVQNSYAALWSEYREVKSEIPLANVIRRILEYYFLQLCGYNGTDLKQRILVDHKADFIKKLEDGTQDTSQYQLVSSMLSYIVSKNVNVIDDGLNFVTGTMDVGMCRRTFEMIFELMGQGQHYSMMMSKKSERN